MTTYDSRVDTYDHIMKVQTYLSNVIKRLLDRMADHDVSKLSGVEKEAFDIVTPNLATAEYGSEEYKAALREVKPAIQEHYRNNSHHPEHYDNGIDGMNLLDLVEMLCDWKAASERGPQPKVEAQEGERSGESNNMEKSLAHNAVRFNISPQLANVLRNTMKEFGWL